jgi:hypothetical protein
MNRDHLMGWTLPAQPLGPAIRYEAIDHDAVFEQMKLADFETKNYTPSTVQQGDARKAVHSNAETKAVVPPSAAPVFKVGSRLRTNYGNGDLVTYGYATEVTPNYRDVTGKVGTRVVWSEDGRSQVGVEFPTWDWAEFLELLSPSTTEDGWIEWRGGECPLPMGTRHELRHADVEEPWQAIVDARDLKPLSYWRVSERRGHSEITHYRILKEQQ